MKKLISLLLLSSLLIAFQLSADICNQKSDGFKKSDKVLNKYKKILENTTWIVPPETLLSFYYEDGTNVSKEDQTIWIINKVEGGYFFGESYTALNGQPTSQKNIVGSITPLGDVYITFFPVTGSLLNTDIVMGIGKFMKKGGKYFFVMQMNTAQNSLTGLSHWSYMISVKPGDYFYDNLPSLNLSVPEFIEKF